MRREVILPDFAKGTDPFDAPDEAVGGGEEIKTGHWTINQDDYDLWKDQW